MYEMFYLDVREGVPTLGGVGTHLGRKVDESHLQCGRIGGSNNN